MEYVKPVLSRSGSARTLILGTDFGDGDHVRPTMTNTRPVLFGLGLDD